MKIIPDEKCKKNMGHYNEARLYNGLEPDENICAGGEYGKLKCFINK